ncbi:hypothetical protein J6590_086937 [Homalodisca vitripennis]|nr:hypothetical protein J6590_086937 [Homalodisca vitripennis]
MLHSACASARDACGEECLFSGKTVFFLNRDEDQPPEKETHETQDTASSSCRQQKFLPTPQTCRGIKRKIDDDGKKKRLSK